VAERLKVPFRRIEISVRDSAVVLQNQSALFQDEIAQIAISVAMQQIGCALDEGIGLAERTAEFEQSALVQAFVGNIAAEIVKRLPRMGLVGKDDSYASHAVLRRRCGLPAFAFGVGWLDVAVLVKDDGLGFADGLSGARQEYVDDRQGAEDRPRA